MADLHYHKTVGVSREASGSGSLSVCGLKPGRGTERETTTVILRECGVSLSLLRERSRKNRGSWGGRSLDSLESEREMEIRVTFQ